jgi:hypothetical protein
VKDFDISELNLEKKLKSQIKPNIEEETNSLDYSEASREGESIT